MIVLSWVFTPHSELRLFWCFRGMYCLHLRVN